MLLWNACHLLRSADAKNGERPTTAGDDEVIYGVVATTISSSQIRYFIMPDWREGIYMARVVMAAKDCSSPCFT